MNRYFYIIKISALFIVLVCSLNVHGQGGADCAAALAAPIVLPFNSPAETNCTMLNDYTAANTTACGNTAYLAGEDKVYAFTPATSGSILITITSAGAKDMGMFLFEGCPAGGICILSNTSNTVSPTKIMAPSVMAGKTYYLLIDQIAGVPPCQPNYLLDITAPDPTCFKVNPTVINATPNSDFENGNFSNWTGSTGTCCPINVAGSGIVAGRHAIMSGTGKDPNTGGAFPVVAPGGKFSARLGNSNTGAEAERLSYKFKVLPNKNFLVYRYAVVLQDPGHAEYEQPRFEIRVLDDKNNEIVCGTYKVAAGPAIPCFQSYLPPGATEAIVYKDWTAVGIDLRDYLNKNITVDFSTGDCSAGGHYGYAYLDVSTTTLEITIDEGTFCLGDTQLTLNGPQGFSGYQWSTGATTPSIIVKNPKKGDTYSLTLTPVSGFQCSSSISITLDPNKGNPIANFNTSTFCFGDSTFFSDSSLNITPGALSHKWDFGDTTTATIVNPNHLYKREGTYDVTLIVGANSTCADTITKKVTIAKSKIVAAPQPVCKPLSKSSVQFSWNSIQNADRYEVSTDNGATWKNASSGTTASDTIHRVSGLAPGQQVKVMVRTLSGSPCNDTTISSEISCSTVDCPTLAVPVVQCKNQGKTSIELSWNNAANASKYEVSTDRGNTWIAPGDPANNKHLITGLKPGTSHYFMVRSISAAPCADTMTAAEVNCQTENCGQMSNPASSCLEVSQNELNFSWTAIPDASFYEVKIDNSIWQKSGNNGTDTNYAVTNLTDGQSVNFELRAINLDPLCPDTTYASAISCATTPNPPCVDLGKLNAYCYENDESSILVKWTAVADVNYYELSLDKGNSWSTYTITDMNDPSYLFTGLENDQEYSFTVRGIRTGRCADTTVSNIASCITPLPSILEFPDVFSPNGDGNNDKFTPRYQNISNYNLSIYNRWGERIYESKKPEQTWNGYISDGSKAPMGVYVYLVTALDRKGKPIYKVGLVTVIE